MADGSGMSAAEMRAAEKAAAKAKKEREKAAKKKAREKAKATQKEPDWWRVERFAAISDRSQNKVTTIAVWVAVIMMVVNMLFLATYAFANATSSGIMATYGVDATWATIANGIIIGCTVILTCMMQAGTDLGLLFASGLVKGKFKITPTLSVILFASCCLITLNTKFSLYESMKDVRIEKLKEAEKPNLEQAQSIRWMSDYRVDEERGAPPREVPRPVEALNEAIKGYSATKTTVEDEITRLQAEYKRISDDAEDEKKTGRGDRYNGLVVDLEAKASEIKEKRNLIAPMQDQIIAATMERSERTEYEHHSNIISQWENRPEITDSDLAYDSTFSMSLRAFGPTLLGILSILVAFASDKIDEDRRKLEAEKEKRSKAGKQAARTRAMNGEYADFTEEPVEFVALTEMDVSEGVVATASTQKIQSPEQQQQHPDAAGDNHGAQVNGYDIEEGPTDVTNDDDSVVSDAEPDTNAGGEPSA